MSLSGVLDKSFTQNAVSNLDEPGSTLVVGVSKQPQSVVVPGVLSADTLTSQFQQLRANTGPYMPTSSGGAWMAVLAGTAGSYTLIGVGWADNRNFVQGYDFIWTPGVAPLKATPSVPSGLNIAAGTTLAGYPAKNFGWLAIPKPGQLAWVFDAPSPAIFPPTDFQANATFSLSATSLNAWPLYPTKAGNLSITQISSTGFIVYALSGTVPALPVEDSRVLNWSYLMSPNPVYAS